MARSEALKKAIKEKGSARNPVDVRKSKEPTNYNKYRPSYGADNKIIAPDVTAGDVVKEARKIAEATGQDELEVQRGLAISAEKGKAAASGGADRRAATPSNYAIKVTSKNAQGQTTKYLTKLSQE